MSDLKIIQEMEGFNEKQKQDENVNLLLKGKRGKKIKELIKKGVKKR